MLDKNDLLAIAELLNTTLETNNTALKDELKAEIRQTKVLIENQAHVVLQ